ncbi:MAG: orotate phosphoribosyltransferase [Candidatus Bipolaricaulota bacterium]|nr:orotate phosphoribosyltransferase [Candidatus Bipolaricaulota bacterium]
MLTDREVLELLVSTGAILDGHFLLSSGKHAARYIQCARLFQRPPLAHRVCVALAEKARNLGKIDAVIGPALGGIILAYELARVLGVRGMFTEREGGKMSLRRGFEIHRGERVLIAEDVVTTGRSSLEAADVLTEQEAEIVGIACVVDRRVAGEVMSLPIISATKMKIKLYEPGDCPLCRRGIPLVKPGSRSQR